MPFEPDVTASESGWSPNLADLLPPEVRLVEDGEVVRPSCAGEMLFMSATRLERCLLVTVAEPRSSTISPGQE